MTKRRADGSIKAVTWELVEAVGGQYKAADLVGLSQTMMVRYTDPEGRNAETTMPVGVARTLEAFADDPILTRYLAAERGYILLKIPDATASGQLGADCAAIAERAAELFAEIGRASSAEGAGGAEVTPGEAGRLIAELDDTFEPMGAMRSWLVRRRDAGDRR